MIERLLESVDLELLTTRVVGYLPNVLGAVVLILVFWVLGKIIQGVVSTAMSKSRVSVEARDMVGRFVKYGVVVIAAISVADQLGINVASLIAGVGIAGLALSFAAQDTIANLISGVAIVIDRPFARGDWISVGGLDASVTEIRLRTTVLTTFDNETIVVPNKQLAQERLVNYTLTPRIRVRVPIGIAYKEDMDAARQVLLATLQGDERILADPEPVVVVKSLGDSSVNLELRFWTEDPATRLALLFDYTEKGKRALDAAGIEIPYPHLQLFLEQTDGLKLLAADGRRSA